jgi:hypothetical protein
MKFRLNSESNVEITGLLISDDPRELGADGLRIGSALEPILLIAAASTGCPSCPVLVRQSHRHPVDRFRC